MFCRLLRHIDKGALRLLSENQRVVTFSPLLAAELKDLCDESVDFVCITLCQTSVFR
jgi:hypothetical protein